MMYSLVSCLLFTYGVVERIRNMLRSAAVEEFEEMEKIWSYLRVAYPIIYANLTLKDEYTSLFSSLFRTVSSLFRPVSSSPCRSIRIEGCLRSLRRSAYDIEDILDVAATDQLSLEVCGIHATAPKTGARLLYSGDLADSITQLRRSLSQLLEICDTVEQASTAEHKSTFLTHPVFAASFSSITKDTGASSRYYGELWSLPEDAVVGRESEKERIMHWLFNDDDHRHPKVISIGGEAGTGKTTLAKMIYNDDVQVSTNFDLVSWAFAPPSPWHVDLKSSLVEIIRSFTNQSRFYLQRMDTNTLKLTLHGILAGQKYLLVLDNHDWRGLLPVYRKIFEVGSAGSTVILIQSHWGRAGTTKRLELQGLHENDGWSLFAQCARFDEEAEQEYPFLSSNGRSLVDKCHGFPLAIKTLGSMLRTNRDEHSWKQIKESKIWNRSTSHESDTATTAFQISLEHMSPDLLQCLHVSSILSKYKVMSRDQLIFSWMALGLLHSRDGNEDPIDIGIRYCDELALRCFVQLFQSDGHHMVLLHKQVISLLVLLEEVALVSAYEFSPGLYRYLIWRGDESLLDKRFAPDNSTLPTVRAFLFQKYVGPVSKLFLEGLISKLSHARLLLLDGSEFKELPEAIGDLKLLRYLSLAGNHTLKALPDSICNLLNLQTLDLSGCGQLQTLPENMHNLVSLRHLFLSLNLTNVPKRTLKSWTSLHHLKICDCPNLNSLSEGISHLTALKILQIHDCPSIASLPNSIKRLTSLKEISILNCAMLDLTNWDGLEGLGGLQFLQIQGLPKLSKFPVGLESDSLRHLIVSNCQGLTALPECLHKCRNLLEMVIENCANLATLPKGIHEIKTLQVLKILNCPKLIARCQRGVGDDWHLISHIPNIQLIQHQVYQKGAISALPDTVSMLHTLLNELWRYAAELAVYLLHLWIIHPILLDLGSRARDATRHVYDVCWHGFQSLRAKAQICGLLVKAELSKRFGEQEIESSAKGILLLFGEGYEFEKDKLIQLWMAAGFIQLEPMEINGAHYFEELVSQGYILPSHSDLLYKVNSEKMKSDLDMIRDKSTYLRLESTSQSSEAEILHVSVVGNVINDDIFKTLGKFNGLRTLIFQCTWGSRLEQMPVDLYLSFESLVVLDLSGTNIKEFPSSVLRMIQLRYLDLSWTTIEFLPEAISRFQRLQTLKLRGCSHLWTLPTGITRLAELRHLDFDVLGQLGETPKGMGVLSRLQTLSAFIVGAHEGCKITELRDLNNLTGELCIARLEHVESAKDAQMASLNSKNNLKKLELRWSDFPLQERKNQDVEDSVLGNLCPHTDLEELVIRCYGGNSLPSWIDSFPKLASITLFKCKHVSVLPAMQKLPSLEYLGLIGLERLTKMDVKGETNRVAFPKLQRLIIDEMLNLNSWAESAECDFPCLAEVTIKRCLKLPVIPSLAYRSSLKRLEIGSCPRIRVAGDKERFTSLEFLSVENCPLIKKSCLEEVGKNVQRVWFQQEAISEPPHDDDDEDEEEDNWYDGIEA